MTIKIGTKISSRVLQDCAGNQHVIPVSGQFVHLQFRRFSGCPVCNLHLSSFKRKYEEIKKKGIMEIVVFRSTDDALKPYQETMPFPLLGDPKEQLYKEFGVTKSLLSVADPRSWLSLVKGVLLGFSLPEKASSLLGLPADFLISPDGVVIAFKYGSHADDQWSVDELLAIAKRGK